MRDNRTGRGILIISISSISNIISISNAASISGNQNKFWPGYILIVKIGIFILKNTFNSNWSSISLVICSILKAKIKKIPSMTKAAKTEMIDAILIREFFLMLL